MIEEGTGASVDPEDTVFYKHETRFDNGQLVDLQETRKIPEKFPMNDDQFHDFLRFAFLQLKRGSVSFIKLTEQAHKMIYHKSSLSQQRTQEEKDQIRAVVGKDIYIRVVITNIKRDPKCDTQATLADKVIFFERVRISGKELCEEGEWSNAKNLYSRCISVFKNMPKWQKDALTPDDQEQRNKILNILELNVSLCMLKKNMPHDTIKHANEALTYEKNNPKAYYRLYLAYKAINDLDRAKENLELAIKLEPQDKMMRAEHKKLSVEKNSKEKEWYSKMSGFYSSNKLAKIEETDEKQELLRQKVER